MLQSIIQSSRITRMNDVLEPIITANTTTTPTTLTLSTTTTTTRSISLSSATSSSAASSSAATSTTTTTTTSSKATTTLSFPISKRLPLVSYKIPLSPIEPSSNPSLISLTDFVVTLLFRLLNRPKLVNLTRFYLFLKNADNNSILSGPVIVHALALIYRTREIQEQQILHGQYSHQQQHLEHQHSHQHQHSQKQHLEQQHSQQQSTQFHECLYCKIRINRATKHIMQPGQEYELFCVVLMESHKMMEDWAFHCLGWSKLAHLSNTDLIKWERQFLRVIGFDVGVSRVLFDEWILYVCRVASGLGLSEFDNRLIWSSVLKVRKR